MTTAAATRTVKIVIDSKDAAKGQEEVGKLLNKLQKQSQDTEEKVDRIGKAFGALGAAAAALGAVVGSLGAVKDAFDFAGDLKDTAGALGITTDALQEYQYAAAMSGSSADAMSKALQKFTVQAADAQAGTGALKDLFDEYGVSVTDAVGKLKSTEKLLSDFATITQSAASSQEQLAGVTKLLGDESAPLVDVFKQGAGALSELRTEAHEAGAIMQSDLIETAADLGENYDKLAIKMDLKFKSIAISVFSFFTDLSNGLERAMIQGGALIDKQLATFKRDWEQFKAMFTGESQSYYDKEHQKTFATIDETTKNALAALDKRLAQEKALDNAQNKADATTTKLTRTTKAQTDAREKAAKAAEKQAREVERLNEKKEREREQLEQLLEQYDPVTRYQNEYKKSYEDLLSLKKAGLITEEKYIENLRKSGVEMVKNIQALTDTEQPMDQAVELFKDQEQALEAIAEKYDPVLAANNDYANAIEELYKAQHLFSSDEAFSDAIKKQDETLKNALSSIKGYSNGMQTFGSYMRTSATDIANAYTSSIAGGASQADARNAALGAAGQAVSGYGQYYMGQYTNAQGQFTGTGAQLATGTAYNAVGTYASARAQGMTGEQTGAMVGSSIGAYAGGAMATWAMGASAGAWAGPVGMAIGAVIGMVAGKYIAGFFGGEAATKVMLEAKKGSTYEQIEEFIADGKRKAAALSKIGEIRFGIQHVGKGDQMSEEDAAKLLDRVQSRLNYLAKLDNRIVAGFKLTGAALEQVQEAAVESTGRDIQGVLRNRYGEIADVVGGEFNSIFDRLQGEITDVVAVSLEYSKGTAEVKKAYDALLPSYANNATRLRELVGELRAVNLVLESLGVATLQVNESGALTADSLIQAAGGAEEFSSLMGEFYETFASDTEKLALVQKQYSDSIEAINALYGTSLSTNALAFENEVKGLLGQPDKYADVIAEMLKLTPLAGQASQALAAFNDTITQQVTATQAAWEQNRQAKAAILALMDQKPEREKLQETISTLGTVLGITDTSVAGLRTYLSNVNDGNTEAITVLGALTEARIRMNEIDLEALTIAQQQAATYRDSFNAIIPVTQSIESLNAKYGALDGELIDTEDEVKALIGYFNTLSDDAINGLLAQYPALIDDMKALYTEILNSGAAVKQASDAFIEAQKQLDATANSIMERYNVVTRQSIEQTVGGWATNINEFFESKGVDLRITGGSDKQVSEQFMGAIQYANKNAAALGLTENDLKNINAGAQDFIKARDTWISLGDTVAQPPAPTPVSVSSSGFGDGSSSAISEIKTEFVDPLIAEGENLTNSMKTREEIYLENMKKYNDLYSKGYISLQTFERATLSATEALNASAIESRARINDYLNNLSVSDVGAGSQKDQLTNAFNLFDTAIAAGDTDKALGYADKYLGLAKSYYGATTGYKSAYDYVTSSLATLRDSGVGGDVNTQIAANTAEMITVLKSLVAVTQSGFSGQILAAQQTAKAQLDMADQSRISA